MKRLLLSITVALTLLFAPTAMAFNPLGNACTAGSANGQSSACSAPSTDPLTGKNGALAKATQLIALIAGAVAIILILISALQFVTAGGDSKKIADARRTLIGAVVGLLIVATAQGILTFVISKV